MVLPAVLVAVLLVVAVVVGPWRARVLVLALGIGSVVVWTAALVLNASANGQWAPPSRR